MLHLRNLLLYWTRVISPHIFLLHGVKCCTLGNNDHSKGSERELQWISNLWVAVNRIHKSLTPKTGQTCNVFFRNSCQTMLLIFGSNLSSFLWSSDLWMVSWCWASLYKILHLSDISLRKKKLERSGIDLAMSQNKTSEVGLVGLTGQLYSSHISFSVRGNDVELFFISGFSLCSWQHRVGHWPLFVLPDFHFSALCTADTMRITLRSIGHKTFMERKRKVRWPLQLCLRRVCCMCLCGWSTEHACDWLVCLVCVCVCVCVCVE